MTHRPLLAAIVSSALLVAGCGRGDEGEEAAPAETRTEVETETETETETPPSQTTASTTRFTFKGDPESEFCQRSRRAADEPVLDPFEPGLEPREVELRFRALAQRFRGFAEIAPEPLEDDLDLLDDAFQDLAVLLEEADYDFVRLAEGGADISVFDDPALATVADRLAAYQDQVCDIG